MFNIKLIYRSLSDNHIKVMLQISWIIILFFYFVISIYVIVSLPSKTPEDEAFVAALNSLGSYYYVALLFLSILVVFFPRTKTDQYFKNYLSNNQMFLIKYFPTLPMFISSVGVSIWFIGGLLKNLFLLVIGLTLFTIGLFLASIMLILKGYFERQIYYAIFEANKRISNIDIT